MARIPIWKLRKIIRRETNSVRRYDFYRLIRYYRRKGHKTPTLQAAAAVYRGRLIR